MKVMERFGKSVSTEPKAVIWGFIHLFSVLNVARMGQVHLFYTARLLSDQFDPGHETIEARLFTEAEVPWEEIAFRTVKETLERYFADRRAGQLSFHVVDIV